MFVRTRTFGGNKGFKWRGLVPERRKKGPRGQTKYEKKITKRLKRANRKLHTRRASLRRSHLY